MAPPQKINTEIDENLYYSNSGLNEIGNGSISKYSFESKMVVKAIPYLESLKLMVKVNLLVR